MPRSKRDLWQRPVLTVRSCHASGVTSCCQMSTLLKRVLFCCELPIHASKRQNRVVFAHDPAYGAVEYRQTMSWVYYAASLASLRPRLAAGEVRPPWPSPICLARFERASA